MLKVKILVLTWLSALVLDAALLPAQDGFRVAGMVRDANTHVALRSANVYLKNQKKGTTTDVAGKFSFLIPNASDDVVVVFSHIAYFTYETTLGELKKSFYVDMRPRIIPLTGVEIEEEAIDQPEIKKDIPQTISVIEAKNFEIRGYVDAGDLLRTDHSVQIEEELSGQKTVAIRGGNADEVVVMFNGVKMNNAYDNIFDLSLIDLEDIDRFELIKGSNTALYGPEAFSGVINIVPKTEQDYNLRFQQRLGTYRSGNWGLHLHRQFRNLGGSYSIKRGGQRRTFVDDGTTTETERRLENASLHHTANLNYAFTDSYGAPTGSLSAMFIYSMLDYDNFLDNQKLDNSNQLYSMKYSGELFGVKAIGLTASYKELDEDQLLNGDFAGQTVGIDRRVRDQAVSFNAEKTFSAEKLDWLFSYQFQRNELDFLDALNSPFVTSIGLESATLDRQHHGFVSILKYHGEAGSGFLRTVDLDASVRHDRVSDGQDNAVLRSPTGNRSDTGTAGIFASNRWNETTFKFAVNFTGYRNDFLMDGYLTFGKNTKFPTLFQQISSPLLLTTLANQPSLRPEKNDSFEFGMKVARDINNAGGVTGWQLSASYFQNRYQNKFRLFTTPRIPTPFYDNTPDASISGFEGKATAFLFQKKVSVDLGLSKYFISDKAAFPFKSDHKRIFNFNIDHEGYSFQLHLFHENEQVAWLRPDNSVAPSTGGTQGPVAFQPISIPDNTNLDLHLSKKFRLLDFTLFLNMSGRNLLNKDDVVLEGIAIRDRRYYLTLGAQI